MLQPSDVIAGLALLVAVWSLVASLRTAQEQGRQWAVVNMGRVELTDVGFVFYKIMTEDEAATTDWGYNVTPMSILENRRISGYGIPSQIVLYNPASRSRYDNSFHALTLTEARQKLARPTEPVPQGIELYKEFQLDFEFQNLGPTAVSGLSIAVDIRQGSDDSWQEDTPSSPHELGPARKTFKIFHIRTPLNTSLPERLDFRVRILYEDADGQETSKVTNIYFEPATNGFRNARSKP